MKSSFNSLSNCLAALLLLVAANQTKVNAQQLVAVNEITPTKPIQQHYKSQGPSFLNNKSNANGTEPAKGMATIATSTTTESSVPQSRPARQYGYGGAAGGARGGGGPQSYYGAAGGGGGGPTGGAYAYGGQQAGLGASYGYQRQQAAAPGYAGFGGQQFGGAGGGGYPGAGFNYRQPQGGGPAAYGHRRQWAYGRRAFN